MQSLKNTRGLWQMLGVLIVSLILCDNSLGLIDSHDPIPYTEALIRAVPVFKIHLDNCTL